MRNEILRYAFQTHFAHDNNLCADNLAFRCRSPFRPVLKTAVSNTVLFADKVGSAR